MTPHGLTDAEFNVFAAISITLWLVLMIWLGIAIWRGRKGGE